jgi:hypothetical protein
MYLPYKKKNIQCLFIYILKLDMTNQKINREFI